MRRKEHLKKLIETLKAEKKMGKIKREDSEKKVKTKKQIHGMESFLENKM